MATVYISPTGGASTQDGLTADTAYAYSSISSAETDAGAGGTILFTSGDYELTGTTTFNGTGSSGNNITYQSLDNHGAVLKSNTGGTVRVFKIGDTGNTSSVNIKNFKFIDCKLTIANLGSGIIEGNIITSSTSIDVAYLLKVTNGTVGSTGYSKFTNNLINIERSTGNYFEQDTGKLSEFSGNTLYITGLSSGTFYFSYNGSRSFARCAVSKNNIFMTDNVGGGVLDTQASMSQYVNNSCFFQFSDSHNASGGTNNKFEDPQFVDLANGDFRLRPASPCIGAGTAS